MKITKAIEILDDLALTGEVYLNPDEIDAIKLGIEALKQMKAERTIYSFKRHVKMPGETEE